MILFNNVTVIELMLDDPEFRAIICDIAELGDDERLAERRKFEAVEHQDPHFSVLKQLLDRGRAARYRDIYQRLTSPRGAPA